MKKSRLLGAVCACLSISLPAFSADKYWVCDSDSWDVSNCWSNTLGGAGGAGQPLNGDGVYLVQSDSLDRTISYVNAVSPSPVLSRLQIDATGTGSLTLSIAQDTLTSLNEYVGYTGTGVITQTAGVHSLVDSSRLHLGFSSSGNGTYNLSGTGELRSDQNIYIGYDGAGTFNQSGGHVYSPNDILLARNSADSVGIYNLSEGSISAPSVHVGYYGAGLFNQTGGTNSNSYLNVASGQNGNITGTGTYNLSGGALSSTIAQTVGRWDEGVFNQTGGVNNTNGLVLGSHRDINIGTGIGTYNLYAGHLSEDHALIGSSGIGIFNQSGGINNITDYMMIGGGSDGEGTYNLSNTSVLTTNKLWIGSSGKGIFNQSGGTNTVSNTITLARHPGSSGRYTLSGGVLDARNIVVNAGGSFNFDGGILSVDSFTGDLTNKGGTLAPGNSPGITNIFGDYSQAIDGTFFVEVGGIGASEFDILDVTGVATLGGTLAVDLYDLGGGLFNPTLGDSFDILFAQTISGEFDILSLAGLGSGLGWDVSYILDAFGTDIVRLSVQAVPIPATVWLFGSGLLGLIGVARRKKAIYG